MHARITRALGTVAHSGQTEKAPVISEMGNLLPEQIAPLAAHPTLRRASMAMGSQKKTRAAQEALPRRPSPEPGYLSAH